MLRLRKMSTASQKRHMDTINELKRLQAWARRDNNEIDEGLYAIELQAIELNEDHRYIVNEIQHIQKITAWDKKAMQYFKSVNRVTFLQKYSPPTVINGVKQTPENNMQMRDWVEQVLSFNSDGISMTLADVHILLAEPSPLAAQFAGTMMEVLKNMLWSQPALLEESVPRVENYMKYIQRSGYRMWFKALLLRNDTLMSSDVSHVYNDIIRTRMPIQNRIFECTSRVSVWPGIKGFGLIQAKGGCPYGFTPGSLWQSIRDGKQDPTDLRPLLAGTYDEHSHGWNFCMRDRPLVSNYDWPEGSYCLLQHSQSECPNNFTSGFIQWDDRNTGNHNNASGSLPRGRTGADTRLYFCCRETKSNPPVPISLPVSKPFVIFAYQSQPCPVVTHMTLTSIKLTWGTMFSQFATMMDGEVPVDPSSGGAAPLVMCHYSRAERTAPSCDH